jgi:ammonium transporter, Amt family
MFKYVKAVLIIVLLLLGASLVNGKDVSQAADSSAASILGNVESSSALAGLAADPSKVDGGPYKTMDEFRESDAYVKFALDNVWILLSAFLVFVMHLGFASVESGFMPARNTVNVIYKNVFILTTGILTYAIVGFRIMYPGEFNIIDGVLGFPGFGIGFDPSKPTSFLTTDYGMDMTIWSDFLFQAMFAATAATIVSGSVTGRIKMPSYMIYTGLLVAFSYPITGSWKWGAGWLDTLGFHDFAGSTLVHAVGGAAALVGAWMLGPRLGKFTNGKANDIAGHNLPLATIGVLLLWFGWFGFNGGSVLSAQPDAIGLVLVNTALAAAAGSLAAMAAATFLMHKMDLGMALNGILGGLVGITAGADVVDPGNAIIIGALSGGLVVASIMVLEKMGIDDPVSAISVHGVCGIWGTLAVGLFADVSFVTQLVGTLSVVGFTLIFSFVTFTAIKLTIGIRADHEAEVSGMDAYYHGHTAYPDFMPKN